MGRIKLAKVGGQLVAVIKSTQQGVRTRRASACHCAIARATRGLPAHNEQTTMYGVGGPDGADVHILPDSSLGFCQACDSSEPVNHKPVVPR
jgi:hypothetical protein